MDDSAKPQKPWLAALLSLFTACAAGQIYTGHFVRAALFWIAWPISLLLIVVAWCSWKLNQVGFYWIGAGILLIPILRAIDAYHLAGQEPRPRKRYQRWWFIIAVWLLADFAYIPLLALFTTSVSEAFLIPTVNMHPTLQRGDRILVSKLIEWDDIRRNDVVVYYSNGPGTTLFVSRVVGLPGETIRILDEKVFVDGEPYEDKFGYFDEDGFPYDIEIWKPGAYEPEKHEQIKIPDDCFFVLGDHRRSSKDSRIRGPIPLSDYYANVKLIYFAIERIVDDPFNIEEFREGEIRWDRMGTYID